MTDNYESAKSSQPQDVNEYSPFIDKQYDNYISGLNAGVYNSTSLSSV